MKRCFISNSGATHKRTLEAKGGERDIPLVDASVWVHKHVNLSFTNVSLRFGLCLLET